MESDQTFDGRMVVLELDGTVVHDHTPSKLIRGGFSLQPERYEQALELYQRESCGNVKAKEALLQYAAPARGLTLRKVIEYATFKMRFINGFDTLIEMLYQNKIPLLFIYSGFGIIMEVILQLYGPDRFQAVLANSLAFGLEKDPEDVITKVMLLVGSPVAPNDLCMNTFIQFIVVFFTKKIFCLFCSYKYRISHL